MTGVKGLTNPSNMRDCESGYLFDIMATLMHHANGTKSINFIYLMWVSA